jgi:uncharacterized membrane protein (DUF106 family)
LEELQMGLWIVMKRSLGAAEWLDYLKKFSLELTAQIAEAESKGDNKKVNRLLRKKDRVNRIMREIPYVDR